MLKIHLPEEIVEKDFKFDFEVNTYKHTFTYRAVTERVALMKMYQDFLEMMVDIEKELEGGVSNEVKIAPKFIVESFGYENIEPKKPIKKLVDYKVPIKPITKVKVAEQITIIPLIKPHNNAGFQPIRGTSREIVD